MELRRRCTLYPSIYSFHFLNSILYLKMKRKGRHNPAGELFVARCCFDDGLDRIVINLRPDSTPSPERFKSNEHHVLTQSCTRSVKNNPLTWVPGQSIRKKRNRRVRGRASWERGRVGRKNITEAWMQRLIERKAGTSYHEGRHG